MAIQQKSNKLLTLDENLDYELVAINIIIQAILCLNNLYQF
jgi:hypothetical protein